MCFPPVIAALALGASGLMQYAGAKKAENAQNRTFQAEQRRQNEMTAEQQVLFQDSLARAGGMADPAAAAAAAAKRESALSDVVAPAMGEGSYLPGSSSAPTVVQRAKERASVDQKGQTGQLAAALARLGGTGDQLLTTGIENARNAGRIGQTASFKAGSAGVLDSEMQAAAHKGSTLRGLGQFIQQVGMAALTAGAGAGAGAATGSGAATGTTAATSGMPNLFSVGPIRFGQFYGG